MEKSIPTVRLSLVALLLVTVHLNTDVTEAMQVTSTGPQTIQIAQGGTVTLGCTYTADPLDTGDLDIEWSNVKPDMTQKDILLLSYAGGQVYYYGDSSLSKRLAFTANASQGDASVSITNLKVSDTATYQCKVKKTPGADMRKVTLVVLVPPSVPKCWVDGGQEIGGTVSLRCKSSQGSTPLSYQWTRQTGGAMPPTATQASQTGELLITNHSVSYTGIYACQVQNAVGNGQCTFTLSAYNPVNKAGVIAGAVIGALLLLLLLLLLIWLLICCCRKRRYQKEVANEIREDVAAPESRPTSRQSSFRSIMGYRTHAGVDYSELAKAPPSRTASARSNLYMERPNGTPQPPARGVTPLPSLKYDSRYGYPV